MIEVWSDWATIIYIHIYVEDVSENKVRNKADSKVP